MGGGGGALHGDAGAEAFDAMPAAGWGGDVEGNFLGHRQCPSFSGARSSRLSQSSQGQWCGR